MPGVVFRRLDLLFGCHDRSFEFPEGSSPVVVTGPNGSGKSTLIEALARTLFGFNLRLEEDREIRDGRRPWSREECRGRLVFRAADGRDWELDRDFTSHATRLRRVDGDGDEDAFEGDANPAGENPEAAEFRRRLGRLFGLPRLTQYVATTCIAQGALGETSLSRDLLEAASGGRVDVEEARRRIEEAHRELTSGPIRKGEPSARKDRRLERLESEIRELSRRLDEAERANETRKPLLRERDDLQARLAVLDSELAELDAAVGPLSRRRTLTLEVEASRRRIRRLEEAEHRLGRAAEGVREAERDLEAALEPGEYPGDLPERLARLEELWARRRELEEELEALEARETGIVIPPLWSLLASGGVAALGGILWALAESVPAGIAGGLGLATAGALGVVRYARTRARTALRNEIEGIRSRLRGVRERIADRMDGIPAGQELSNATADRHRARFRRQEEARSRLEAARGERTDARDRAESVLEETAAAGVSIPGPETPEEGDPARRLRLALGEVRNDLARQELALEKIRDVDLPEGVPEDLGVIEGERERRRAERRQLSDDLQELRRRILESRPSESPGALEDELEAREAERDEVARRVLEYRRARALLVDSWEAFRAEDETRLIRAVSDELHAVSGGTFGPLVAEDGLESVKLRAFDRVVPLSYRPLSFGQHLTVLLAIRLGIADFLAQARIRVPLLLDEPFAHLDDDNASAVWDRLLSVAETRQVLVTTQESRLLERMGVEPDIRLEGRPELVTPSR